MTNQPDNEQSEHGIAIENLELARRVKDISGFNLSNAQSTQQFWEDAQNIKMSGLSRGENDMEVPTSGRSKWIKPNSPYGCYSVLASRCIIGVCFNKKGEASLFHFTAYNFEEKVKEFLEKDKSEIQFGFFVSGQDRSRNDVQINQILAEYNMTPIQLPDHKHGEVSMMIDTDRFLAPPTIEFLFED